MSGVDLEDGSNPSISGFDFPRFVKDARSNRLGFGFLLAGWCHLLIFGFCEYLFAQGDRAPIHFVPLWFIDVVFAFLMCRARVITVGSTGPDRSAQVAIRIWITFAILCLTSASLNKITGFEVEWFKISWAMLGTFGFANMAWLFHLAFLIPAVQMSITALLIAAYPDHAYAILGVSWFLTLQGFGLLLEKHRMIERLPSWTNRQTIVVIRRNSTEV